MPLNGCTVPPMDEEPRDYLAEARAIAAGSSRLLARAEHLKAVFAMVAQQAANVQQASELVAAYVLDAGSQEVFVPAELLAEVRRRKLHLFVEQTNDGVKVRLAAPPPRIHG